MNRGQVSINPLVPVSMGVILSAVALVAIELNQQAAAAGGDISYYCAGLWGCELPPAEWVLVGIASVGLLTFGIAGLAVYDKRRANE